MKCKDIASAIETLAPKNLAYEWDNVGLLCGDYEQDVKKVLLTLDLDQGVVEEAVKIGADMIVGHHPIMFNPINKINECNAEGKVVRSLIRNNISYYAAHTNLDVAKGGLNDLLAKKLGLENTSMLEAVAAEGEGIGRIGTLKNPVSLADYCEKIKDALGAEAVRFCGCKDALIQKVAINTGGGTSLIDAAIAHKADVFVTGDYKYSQVRDCRDKNMMIVDVCHYDTEIIACEIFEKIIKDTFGDKVEVAKTTANKNVMRFI